MAPLDFDISQYRNSFINYGYEHNVRPELLAALAITESSLNPKAKSRRGAMGLFQITPNTFRAFGGEDLDPYNPEHSIQVGSRYLGHLLDQFEGDEEKAIAAYNFGPTKLRRLIRQHGDRWREYLPRETRNHLKKVFSRVEQYRPLFEEEPKEKRRGLLDEPDTVLRLKPHMAERPLNENMPIEQIISLELSESTRKFLEYLDQASKTEK